MATAVEAPSPPDALASQASITPPQEFVIYVVLRLAMSDDVNELALCDGIFAARYCHGGAPYRALGASHDRKIWPA
eukprot:CAMPEP_0117544418 /NCGR_PEP_ID=MMETSP0784-20121206/45561_1 /TAXON_ID=39447 /ORGANISM="" /LENGTH=75 /DNA_ID=CAMNT_0005341217 /DNA_START=445 /DNA_END=669 /DNA_ORIENTATION=+